MNKNINLAALYFALYAISGLNYKMFSLFLLGNPILNIGLYSGITALLLYSPLYSLTESLLITKKPYAPVPVSANKLAKAVKNYGWALFLSILCSAGWQVITYSYLVNAGPLLAMLVTTFSRLLTPLLSAYLFGDTLGKPKWYWLGLLVSVTGMVAYQAGGGEPMFNRHVNWTLYVTLSAINLTLQTLSSMIKRYITSDPVVDSIPRQPIFLGIRYKKDYHMSVSFRGMIVEFTTCILLLTAGLLCDTQTKSLSGIFTPNVIKGVCWIGLAGGLAYNLSLRITNMLSNVITIVLDGVRPLALLFLFPLVSWIFAGSAYHLTLSGALIGYVRIPGLNLIGIGFCCLGAIVSLKFGKPQKSPIKTHTALSIAVMSS